MSRLRRFVIGALKALAVLVALLVVAHTIAVVVTGRQLQHELDRIRASGAPVSAAQRAPKPVPDDENAAILYQKAFGALRLTSEQNTALSLFISNGGQEPQLPLPAAGRPPAKHLEPLTPGQARALLARNAEAIALTEEASRRPACVFPVHWEAGIATTFVHLPRLALLARLLEAKAVLLAIEGKPGEAFEVCRTLLRIQKHLAPEMELPSQLTRLRIERDTAQVVGRILALSSPAPANCRAMAEALSRVGNTGALARALEGERAAFLFAFDQMRAHKGMAPQRLTLGGLLQAFPRPLYTSYLGRPVFNEDWTRYLRGMAKRIHLAEQPLWVAAASNPALAQPPPEPADPGYWASFWFPMSSVPLVYARFHGAFDLANAEVGMAQVALAAYVCKQKTNGYPGSLAQLQRVVGWPLPNDPFSGRPFIYRRERSGYLLYSVGFNLKDNGGVPVRPTERNGWWQGDIVWRVER